MEAEAINELKLQFKENTGLVADDNAADFGGWLFMQRQKVLRELILDLNERNQNQPVTVKHMKAILNRLLLY